jgi:hypothetical protein
MNQEEYPSVNIDFLHQLLIKCPKLQGTIEVGSTIAYILKGTSYIGKRTILLRKNKNNHVDFNFAISVGYKTNQLGEILEWLKENKNWKDGGYIGHTVDK